MDGGTIALKEFIEAHRGALLAIGTAKGCGYIAVAEATDRLTAELSALDDFHAQRTEKAVERLTILIEQEETREQAARHDAHVNRVAEMTARQSFDSDATLQRYRASVDAMERLAGILPEDIADARERLLRREGRLKRRIGIFAEQAEKAERVTEDARRKKERFENSLEAFRRQHESYKPILERDVIEVYRTKITPAQIHVIIEGEDTGRFWDAEEYRRWRDRGWEHGAHRP